MNHQQIYKAALPCHYLDQLWPNTVYNRLIWMLYVVNSHIAHHYNAIEIMKVRLQGRRMRATYRQP